MLEESMSLLPQQLHQNFTRTSPELTPHVKQHIEAPAMQASSTGLIITSSSDSSPDTKQAAVAPDHDALTHSVVIYPEIVH
jgi:hypothetical protein